MPKPQASDSGSRRAPDLEAAVRRHKALGAPIRLRILRLLAERKRIVREVASVLHVSLPTASRHLLILARAGLVERARRGRVVVCRLSTAGAEALGEAALVDDRTEAANPVGGGGGAGPRRADDDPGGRGGLRTADPEEVELQLNMGASLLPYAARTREAWDAQMKELFGVGIMPHLAVLYTASVRVHRRETLDDLPLPPRLVLERFNSAGPPHLQKGTPE